MRRYSGVHLLEMVKARICVDNGDIQVLEDPQLNKCHLRSKTFGHEYETRDTMRNILSKHMEDLGLFSKDRVLELEKPGVTWGAHEMMADCLQEKIIDAAAVVCDGAGSVVVSKGNVVRAIGAVIPLITETQIIPNTQKKLKDLGCFLVDEKPTQDGGAVIDQTKGIELAIEKGYKRIGVTVAGITAPLTKEFREVERRHKAKDVQVIIFAVHTSKMTEEDARILIENADIVWGCASKASREIVGPKAIFQLQGPVPVFAMNHIGKRCMLARALYCNDAMVCAKAALPVLPPEIQPDPVL